MAKTLRRIALIVGVATTLSKGAGLVRQQVIAAAFGLGSAYDAYNYAYVLPGFLLVLLGGINGPFHSSIVSALVKNPKSERKHVLTVINTVVGVCLLGITFTLVVAADPLITLVGPALEPEIHSNAVIQLRCMAPIALFAGLIGVGFGTLNATEKFWVPSVSPMLSSISVIVGVGLLWWQLGPAIDSPQFALLGGAVLSISTLLGAILQWLIQLPDLVSQKLINLRLVWDLRNSGVKDVFKVMGPATLSAGMLQVNVFTDLFFASGILGAAAGLSYAGLLAQTPVGLVSTIIIIPLLPVFSRLTALADRPKLISHIHQGLMVGMASILPIAALFVALAEPIVQVIYERGAFDSDASSTVAILLMVYSAGMPAYLGREIIVRVFYALGDALTPFRFSIGGIGLNIILDWLFVGGPTPWGLQVPALNFGAPGLVFATVSVNFLAYLGLLLSLQGRIEDLPVREWGREGVKLLFAAIAAGLVAWKLSEYVVWPPEPLGHVIQITICCGSGLITYGVIAKGIEWYH